MHKALRRLQGALGRLQTGWSILGITLVVLLLVEGGFRLVFAVRDQLTAVAVPDLRVVADGYGGAKWPVVHYRELEQLEERWQPYVYFRQKPFQGETITIGDGGLRATWQSPAPAAEQGLHRSVKILSLGGSSLWGFGARDDQTIPSLLARSLHEKGWRVELRNLAEIGYVSTQEVIALTRELQAGYRPDLVIFYDGVNDATSALLEGEPGVTTNEVNRRNEFNLLQSPGRLAAALAVKLGRDSGAYRFSQMVRRRLGRETSSSHAISNTFNVPDVAAGVVRLYEANVIVVQALAKSYGFRPLFLWQPTVFTKPARVAVEEEEAQKFAWAEPFLNDVYDRVRASAPLNANPAFRNLSAVFDDTNGLVFIDYCHTTESANARIASEMAALVVGSQSQ
jgi:lysophospholipase L1-like esterase